MNFVIGKNNNLRGADSVQLIGCNDMQISEADNGKTIINSGAFEVTDIKIKHNVTLVNTNYIDIDSATVNLIAGKRYIIVDTLVCNYTMADIVGNEGTETFFYNKGSNIVNVNTFTGLDDFFYNGSPVNSFTMLPGEWVYMFNDNANYSVYGIKKPRVFIGSSSPAFFETNDIWIDI